MPVTKWDALPSGGGVYGIWSADRASLYIGSTGHLAARLSTHRPAEMLGCEIEVVLSLPGSTRSERNRWEDRAILAMRRAGVRVVNPTNTENHETHLRHTPEQYREWARRGLGRLTPEQRSENGRKGQRAMTKEQLRRGAAALTKEQLRAAGKKGAAARWHSHQKEN